MNHLSGDRTQRRRLLTASLILPAILLGVIGLAQQASKPAKAETAGKKYKNIQVLKDLPADQLIPMMHAYNTALNVKCDFCHVVNDNHTGFEKDDKPMKGVARKMILMVNDLNAHQKVLNKQATCYMCHHGHPEPETKPMAAP